MKPTWHSQKRHIDCTPLNPLVHFVTIYCADLLLILESPFKNFHSICFHFVFESGKYYQKQDSRHSNINTRGF